MINFLGPINSTKNLHLAVSWTNATHANCIERKGWEHITGGRKYMLFINAQSPLENRMELGLKLPGQTTVVANSLMQGLVLPTISCQSSSTSTGNVCIHAKFSSHLELEFRKEGHFPWRAVAKKTRYSHMLIILDCIPKRPFKTVLQLSFHELVKSISNSERNSQHYMLLLCSFPPAEDPNTFLWASGRCQTPNLHLTLLQILRVVLGEGSSFFLWKVSRGLCWKLDSL